MSPELLSKPMFTESLAAEYLRVPPSTLHAWLEGRTVGRREYAPVLRAVPTGRNEVRWGEFIEAGLLRQYRNVQKVPMKEMRTFIEILRDHAGVANPLATMGPFVGPGRKLLIDAQAQSKLPERFWLAASQELLLAPAENFLERVDWSDAIAVRWRPGGAKLPVVNDPRVRFGAPSIGGIKTAVILEHVEGGEDFEEIAEQFGLSVRQVRQACAYEWGEAAAA